MEQPVVGVIGGSGLYEIEGLTDVKEVRVETPFGDPSDVFITGSLKDVKMVFLPRHGKGHRFLPSELNFRANIYGMKKLGVQQIISVSAVGSMRGDIAPGHIVVPDQFIDRTKGRINTFFGNGIVGHVEFADPVCKELSVILYNAAVVMGMTVHKGGTYICMEGPQFSTRAESLLYRKWGVDIIGMTNIPEAKLAREAEICYGTVALVTDYDCWHEAEEDVTIEAILEIIKKNVSNARKVISYAVEKIPANRACKCANALQHAIITNRDSIPDKAKKDLNLLIGKYIH